MWALLHAWCSRPVVGFVAIIFAPVAWAHHGADLADELPLWQIISVAAVVALYWSPRAAELVRSNAHAAPRHKRRRARAVGLPPAGTSAGWATRSAFSLGHWC